ncbi:17505_t:CDS:2 [Rhizophagus irregularis]|nr:17505_t:CDS:2 [Rhizophagus irregularis]
MSFVKKKQYKKDIHNNGQEIIQVLINENTTNYEPDYHGQEIILTLKNKNTTDHEPIIVPANDYNGQEIMQTLKMEIQPTMNQ